MGLKGPSQKNNYTMKYYKNEFLNQYVRLILFYQIFFFQPELEIRYC